MQTTTILLLILAAIVALGLVLFQYYYNSKKRDKFHILLSFLRFISLFGIFILLINPKLTKNEYTLEKANLIVLSDNSSSIEGAKSDVLSVISSIENNKEISEKYKVAKYTFGTSIETEGSLSFTDRNTNISKALHSLNEVYANSNTAIVLLSDGNQTIGQDYSYNIPTNNAVYPVVIGDTTQYEDIHIANVISNKYTFLKNKFPLEIVVSYSGRNTIKTKLKIEVNGERVYSENFKLSHSNTVKTIHTLLNAKSVGVKNIKISVDPIENERTIKNNNKNIAIEVIDEKTNIALISDIMHPDIGALKKSIERNEQRSVTIYKPSVGLKELEDADLFILYQPNAKYREIYKLIKQKKASVFSITGANTNWNVVNRALRKYNSKGGYPNQEVFGDLNTSFTKFDISDFSMDGFPPLESNVGPISIEDGETLLQMRIMGKTQNKPLLFAQDNENGKEIVLFGENIWKWRVHSYRNDQNFDNFDDFISKLILYLASNSGKNRLEIDYQTIYEGSSAMKIKASYFDETFVFDTNANLFLKTKSKTDNNTIEVPMLLKGNYYESDLSDLKPDQYTFVIAVKEHHISKSGSFTIVDFDVEKQFLSSNYKKLKQLSKRTNGAIFSPNQIDALVQKLINNKQYTPTQKSSKNIVSLIDFRIVLALIIAALAAEWFIRKYNGLI